MNNNFKIIYLSFKWHFCTQIWILHLLQILIRNIETSFYFLFQKIIRTTLALNTLFLIKCVLNPIDNQHSLNILIGININCLFSIKNLIQFSLTRTLLIKRFFLFLFNEIHVPGLIKAKFFSLGKICGGLLFKYINFFSDWLLTHRHFSLRLPSSFHLTIWPA